jgi:ribosomal protein L14
MIQKKSKIKVIDNTPVKEGSCIHVYNKKKGIGRIGDLVLISVLELEKDQKKTGKPLLGKYKKGSIYKGIIVESKKNSRKKKLIPYRERFDQNSIILVNSDSKKNNVTPLGNRVSLPVSRVLSLDPRLEKLVAITPSIIL